MMYQHDQKCKQSFLFVHESAYEEDIMHILNRADKAPTALTAPLQTKRQTDRQTHDESKYRAGMASSGNKMKHATELLTVSNTNGIHE